MSSLVCVLVMLMVEASECAEYCFGVIVRWFNLLSRILATRAYLLLAAMFVEVSG